MTPHLADVEVCLPGRGCVYYVPGAGQALNALIAIGPQVLDGFLAGALGALVLVGVVAVVSILRGRGKGDRRPRLRGSVAAAAALLIAGGAVAAVPVLVPAAMPVAEVFALAASFCVGVALLVLAGAVPPAARLAATIAGAVRLLSLPVAVLQFLLAAPSGPFPSDAVEVLGALMLAVAGVALLLTGRRFGPMRWALLLPPVAALLTGIRLEIPFASGSWVDLLPDVAVVVCGLLVLASRPEPVLPAQDARQTATLMGGAAAVLAVTVTVLLAWPAVQPGERDAGEPAIGPVRAVTASTPLLLPLDDFQQPSKDRDLVIRVENVLITRCAARQRVAVQPADLIPAEIPESNTSLLGLIGPQRAASIGYWSPPAPESLGGAQSTRDLGVLVRCVRTARARLDDDGTAQESVQESTFQALARTDVDSRVERLQTAWSRCMQLRGFSHSTPTEVAWSQATTFPTPDDTRAASASVTCERLTDLPGLRAAVLVAWENRAIVDHGEQLDAARARLLAQTRTADAILRGRSAEEAP